MRRLPLLALAVLAVGLTGCGKYAASLRVREAVVAFAPGASPAQYAAARTACSGFAFASPEPLPRSTLPAAVRGSVRFRVDGASDRQLNQLYQCLRQQPGVQGVNIVVPGN